MKEFYIISIISLIFVALHLFMSISLDKIKTKIGVNDEASKNRRIH